MSRRRSVSVFAVLVLFLAGLAGACGSDSGNGDTTPTVACDTTDTGASNGEASATDTTLVGNGDPTQGAGDLGAGSQSGANDQDQQDNSAAGGFSTPQNTNPDLGDGTGGNADTGSGGSSRTC